MFNEKKAANALGGKTARACDGCLRKRARWFCPSDDAFLCQFCDTSVHSANQLASRHSRVRLETASSKPVTGWAKIEPSSPLWYQGFTRKARSPRGGNGKNTLLAKSKVLNSPPLVPEIGNEEEGNMVADDSEDQLPLRVPVFDPFTEELNNKLTREELERANEKKLDDFLELQLPSDIDLGEFEYLLKSEFDEGIEPPHVKSFEKDVKIKDEAITDCNWDFCFDLPVVDEVGDKQEQEEKVVPVSGFVGLMMDHGSKDETKKNMFLRLNYEAVISAWGGQASPCIIGNGSQFSDCHISGYLEVASPKYFHPPFGGASGKPDGSDGGREARVLRYKEKRRTRLFSKKIRYEVRKLNAEKRPRMKGRFVKRTSFVGNEFPCVNHNK